MDVMKPPLIWIKGRCYRVAATKEANFNNTSTHEKQSQSADGPSDNCPTEELDDCAPNECALDIKELTDGRYELRMDIPAALCGIIIGKMGSTSMRIESETNTTLSVPKHSEQPTVIRGNTRLAVQKAYIRIHDLVEIARSRESCTHFLSLPLTAEAITKRFQEFQNQILEKCGQDYGMCRKLFQPYLKLHLTLGVMVLLNNNERNRASEVLQECADIAVRTVGSTPLKVKVKGLAIMNDDPSEVHVLYAKVCTGDGSDRLQQLADHLVDHFSKADLIDKKRNEVKLHATLMNSRFVADNRGVDKRNNKRPSFDARHIFEEFGDFDFGEQELTCVHLSRRHTTDANGYYCPSAKLSLTPHVSVKENVKKTPANDKVASASISNAPKDIFSVNLATDISVNDNKLFELKIAIPCKERKFVVGVKGQKANQILMQSDCVLDVPLSSKGADEPTVILGRRREDVERAFGLIKELFVPQSAAQKPPVIAAVDGVDTNDDRYVMSPYCERHVVKLETGGYELRMNIPARLNGIIVGKHGKTRMEIENDTDTHIFVPRNTEGTTVIQGRNRKDVDTAYNTINHLSLTARSRLACTHLLSLPLRTEEIVDRYRQFRERILDSCMSCQGMHDQLFSDPRKLQLTVTTLTLVNEAERITASEILRRCKDTALRVTLGDRPLMVSVKGLEVDSQDQSQAEVVYVKVSMADDSNRLYELADMLMEEYMNANLLRYSPIKLRMTLIDSRTRSNVKEPFDARRILQEFGDFDFGVVHLDSVHLMERFQLGGFDDRPNTPPLPIEKLQLP